MPRSTPYDSPPRLPDGPVDLEAFLAGAGPLELEIGPGRGAFLIERAVAAPEARLLGLEIRRKWACLVDDRLRKLGYGARARVVCEDARLALARLRPDGALARIHLLFPDPWWKKRHHKRLVLVDTLLDQAARLLAPEGELFLATDVAERAGQYRARIDAHAAFVPAGDEPGSPLLADNPYAARSNRERRAVLDGLPVHRLRWKRRPHVTAGS
jgi:tRNA (guanine-N7-)-methyltransferase